MKKEEKEHKYLISLYIKVNDSLASSQDITSAEFPDIVVSFCTVVEKVIKIKLYKKNPLLVFDPSKYTDDSICAIALKKDETIHTAQISPILKRCEVIFKRFLSTSDMQALSDIFKLRNHFLHSHKCDKELSDDMEGATLKMGLVWDKISGDAVKFLGTKNIKASKPHKKYTEKQLYDVLKKEVFEKISTKKRGDPLAVDSLFDSTYVMRSHLGFGSSEIKCPRCESYTLVLQKNKPSIYDSMRTFSIIDTSSRFYIDLYRCKKCGLELTEREYEIVKDDL